ncbi:hypothetical protein Q7P37_011533 [Cladosporium fusiforme]
MGVTGLFDVIGKGELVPTAKLASDHYEKHGRPLRVAIDEAGWRFNNISPAQLEIIRKNEPAANTIEKNIMWRILDLLKINIQPIFVFDGPRRPWKRNKRGGNAVDWERIKLLRQLLDHLKIPHHQAPGEAEAECAAMQRLGVVDAVWSDDSDTLMFGATCVIQAHKTGTTWSKDKKYVNRAEKILSDHDLDHESIVLFAMLSGGDYNTSGLPGCGSKIAGLLSRKQHGLAHALCQASMHELAGWRGLLGEVMAMEGKRIQIPANFPDQKALNHSRQPTISSPEELRNLRGLKDGWDRKINQVKLRVLLRDRFHIWTKGYMKHLAPIFMIQQLTTTPSQSKDAIVIKYDIQLKKLRGKTTARNETMDPERKITFYPLPAIEIDISAPPPEEDWSLWEKNGSHYDPAARVECTVLSCLLHGSSIGAESPSQPGSSQNGSARPAETAPVEPATKQRGRPRKEAATTQVEGSTAESAPKKRGRPKKDASAAPSTKSNKRSKKSTQADTAPEPPAPTFRMPPSFPFTGAASLNPPVTSTEPTLTASAPISSPHQQRSPTESPHSPGNTRHPPATTQWVCPICCAPQTAEERSFNRHIDDCLSKSAIEEEFSSPFSPSPHFPTTTTTMTQPYTAANPPHTPNNLVPGATLATDLARLERRIWVPDRHCSLQFPGRQKRLPPQAFTQAAGGDRNRRSHLNRTERKRTKAGWIFKEIGL